MRRARRESDDALVGEVCRRIPTVPNHKGVGDFAYFRTGEAGFPCQLTTGHSGG
jgi:hypothetical protein